MGIPGGELSTGGMSNSRMSPAEFWNSSGIPGGIPGSKDLLACAEILRLMGFSCGAFQVRILSTMIDKVCYVLRALAAPVDVLLKI